MDLSKEGSLAAKDGEEEGDKKDADKKDVKVRNGSSLLSLFLAL